MHLSVKRLISLQITLNKSQVILHIIHNTEKLLSHFSIFLTNLQSLIHLVQTGTNPYHFFIIRENIISQFMYLPTFSFVFVFYLSNSIFSSNQFYLNFINRVSSVSPNCINFIILSLKFVHHVSKLTIHDVFIPIKCFYAFFYLMIKFYLHIIQLFYLLFIYF